MKEKIIEYLQNIECEWFPAKWDDFVYNCLGVHYGIEEEKIEDYKIKYVFRKNSYSVITHHIPSDLKLELKFPYRTWSYFTVERCQVLLLNAVRSIAEPIMITGRKIKWPDEWFITEKGDEIWMDIQHLRSYESHLIWKKGVFIYQGVNNANL